MSVIDRHFVTIRKMPASIGEDLEKLVADNAGFLLRGAIGMGFSQDDAEELVQDTFVSYLKARERFAGRSSVRTFLFGILHNKGAERSRKTRRETAVDDVESVFEARFSAGGFWRSAPKGPEETALAQEAARLIAICAEKLSVTQRAAFFLKEAEGVPAEEICNVLGVSGTNLRVLLFRARLRLRECLENTWDAR